MTHGMMMLVNWLYFKDSAGVTIVVVIVIAIVVFVLFQGIWNILRLQFLLHIPNISSLCPLNFIPNLFCLCSSCHF